MDGKLSTIDADGQAMLDRMLAPADAIKTAYDQLETNKGMRMIMECADIANKYIDEQAPWALVKENPDQAQIVCTVSLNALRILMIYLSPVLTQVTAKLAQFLNIEPQTWDQLGEPIVESTIQPYEHILKRLVLDEVNSQLFVN